MTSVAPAWVVLPGNRTVRDVALAARDALAAAARALDAAGLGCDDIRRAEQCVTALLSNPEPEAERAALRALAVELEFLRGLRREVASVLRASK